MGAQEDHGAVAIVEFSAELWIDKRIGERENLDGLTSEEHSGEIEVVDGHVFEEATGDGKIFARRHLRVARGDDDLVEISDLPVAQGIAGGAVAGIEAAIEAELDVCFASFDGGGALIDSREAEIDGFFAEDGFFCVYCLFDVVGVCVCGGGDEDGID